MATSLVTLTIPAGDSLSNAADCQAATPVRIRFPLLWTGGPTGVITFVVSTDNTNWFNLHEIDGNEVQAIVIPGPNSCILRETMGLKSGQWIKVRAGTKDRPVVQDAARNFVFVLESIS